MNFTIIESPGKNKKYLVPTETGKLVVDSLAGKFKLMNLEFTRDVQKDLGRIAKDEARHKTVISCVHDQLKQKL